MFNIIKLNEKDNIGIATMDIPENVETNLKFISKDKISYGHKISLKKINKGEYMYFVHSYYADLVKEDEVLSKTVYGGIEYCSSINKNNIFAFQFHPEKSGAEGLKIYKKFNQIIKKEK